MRIRRLTLALVIIVAGCSAVPLEEKSTTTIPNAESSTFNPEEITSIAVEAEIERVEAKLGNNSPISEDTVGVYGNPNAVIRNNSEEGFSIRVTMTYAYTYQCDGESGAVDGLTTESIYIVRGQATDLKRVVENVSLPC